MRTITDTENYEDYLKRRLRKWSTRSLHENWWIKLYINSNCTQLRSRISFLTFP